MSFIAKLKQLIFGGKREAESSIKIVEISETAEEKQEKGEISREEKNEKPLKRERRSIRKESSERGREEKSGKNRHRKKHLSENEDRAEINPEENSDNSENWSLNDFKVEEEEGKKRFHDFDIPETVMHGIFNAGYKYTTPIQSLILPEAFKGTDIYGKAQTGTGKTAAFLITILKHLIENEKEERECGTPRALIMAPTRELVIQIEKDARLLGRYTGFNIQAIFGGINYGKQRDQLENKVTDILAATPGRLLDFREQGVLNISDVEILVIDEADRMLDMGFIPDMRRIISLCPPKDKRQTMLFSATLSPEIMNLASQWTLNAVSYEAEAREVTSETIEQRAYIITDKEKFPFIYNMIKNNGLKRVIVFSNRRDEAARLGDMFKALGINCGVLSGDVSQNKRIRTLEDLREGRIDVLAATDVAARGIHIDDISYVFNYTLSEDPEDYVHRIGRTGRAGANGISVLFAAENDAYAIPKIEEYTGHKLTYITPEPEMTELPEEAAKILSSRRAFLSQRRSGNHGNFRRDQRRRRNS